MTFMMQIDHAAARPLEQLARDYFQLRTGPTRDFCRRVTGMTESDQVIARRLGVAISTVQRWRAAGRPS